jgi:hypothetical protein
MRPEETCPTCGTKLGPLHQREALRRCDACQRQSPRGFRYCGFCATPLPSPAEQAERADVAAPPGGWPNLARELVEMRFFLERGELDEAYELLSILHQRHPGHPALVEFIREPAARRPRPGTDVNQVVDAVLADSSSLSSSSLPRRMVPKWKASVADDGEEGKQTRAHATVPLGNDDEEPTSRRARPKTLEPKKPVSMRAKTDKHLGAVPVAKGEPKPASKKTARAEEDVPKKVARTAAGQTVAVPTLQPPKPFRDASSSDFDEEARPTRSMGSDRARPAKKGAADEPFEALPKKPGKSVVRKRMLESELAAPAKAVEPRKRSGKHATAQPPAEPETGKKRVRGSRFGQDVLGRLGGKDKG